MSDRKLPQRTLKTTLLLATFLTLGLALLGHVTVAVGLALGSAIGLSSLASLTYAVPRMLRPGNPTARVLFGMIAMLKLPIYAVVLNYAMVSPSVQPVAVFVGVALVPVVILLTALLPTGAAQRAVVSARPSPPA